MSRKRSEKLENIARNILGRHYQYAAEFFFTPYLRCVQEAKPRKETQGEIRPLLVVFITRRSNVLSTLFSKIFHLYENYADIERPEYFRNVDLNGFSLGDIEGTHFITDVALIAQSQEIADYYLRNREFPRILIYDELLLHGRALNGLLVSLEQGIKKRVKAQKGDFSEWDETQLTDRFLRALELQVYVRSDETLLLLPRYQKLLHSQYTCPILTVREISRRFSMLIAASSENNVAYSWNISMPYRSAATEKLMKYPEHPDGFFFRTTRMQFGEIIDGLRPYPDAGRPKAICSIRWKQSSLSKQQSENALMLVPFIMFGQIPYENSLRLHWQIVEDLGDLKPRVSFLSVQDSYISEGDHSYARWISETNDLVLNSLLCCHFFQSMGISRRIKPVYSFVARNYASLFCPGQCIQGELKVLWDWAMENHATGKFERYMDLLLADAPPIWSLPESPAANTWMELEGAAAEKICAAVEDAIIQIADETERHAYEKLHSRIFLRDELLSNWGRYYTIGEMVEKAVSAYGGTASVDQRLSMIAILVHEMDLGIVGMNAAYKETDGMVSTITRAGEQALFLEPMRYQMFIPVLLEIQKRCRAHLLDLEKEIRRFVDHIVPDRPELADQLYHFVEKTESLGGKLADWNLILFDDSIPKKIFRTGKERSIFGAFEENVGEQVRYVKEYGKM